jgi:hypothetical protein
MTKTEALYNIADCWKVEKHKPTTDVGGVCVLPAILLTLLDSTRLKNIEETEKAKQVVAEERQELERKKSSDDEEHQASRCESSCTQLI